MNTEKNVNKDFAEQVQAVEVDKKPTTKTAQLKKSRFAKFFSTLDGANNTYVLGYN